MNTLFDKQLEEIREICKSIRLSGISACMADELMEAKEKGLSYEEFLLNVLRYEQDRQNVILLGSTGTGKTHTATALGIKACMEGYKVLFTTVPLLILS
ncbi:ATP-binding protein [Cellulosilyticum ruminicola]|uniref:ATP-binding protein n=1 Tax=Cellulosilyticum ruminicola TaxID=425254 RepID=UPI00241D1B33|nr:ATP-binding protein [Cellulosilyticum ruminicola]